MSIKLISELLVFDVDFKGKLYHASLRTELTTKDEIHKIFWAMEYKKGLYINGEEYDELKNYVQSEIEKAEQPKTEQPNV
jgi:hypothetical protein